MSKEQQILRRISLLEKELAELKNAYRVLQSIPEDGEFTGIRVEAEENRLAGSHAIDDVSSASQSEGEKDLKDATIQEACIKILGERGEAHFTDLTHEAIERGYQSTSSFYSLSESFRKKLRTDKANFLSLGQGCFRLRPPDYKPPRTIGDLTGLSVVDAAAKVLVDAGATGWDLSDIVSDAVQRGFQHHDPDATIERIELSFREGLRRSKYLFEETREGRFRLLGENGKDRSGSPGEVFNYILNHVIPELPASFSAKDVKDAVNDRYATTMISIYKNLEKLEDQGVIELVEEAKGRTPAKYGKL